MPTTLKVYFFAKCTKFDHHVCEPRAKTHQKTFGRNIFNGILRNVTLFEIIHSKFRNLGDVNKNCITVCLQQNVNFIQKWIGG